MPLQPGNQHGNVYLGEVNLQIFDGNTVFMA